MVTQDRLYQLALKAGCQPQFYDGILGPRWHCGCGDLRHSTGQQCSVITEESLRKATGPITVHGLYGLWLETRVDRIDREVVVDTGQVAVYLTPGEARKVAHSLLGLADEVEGLKCSR